MYRHILVPVDGSDTSNKALLAALEVAGLNGGQVRLVHALELPAVARDNLFRDHARAALRAQGQAVLQRALDIVDAAEISADTRLLEAPGGRLGEMVAHEARAWPADIIVVGSHGRRGTSRSMLGSGAEQIVRLAPVPVLVVPDAAKGMC